MIGKLSGIVDALGSGEAILDVSGVGYLVQCGGAHLAHFKHWRAGAIAY
ncbi:MAG: OB-fold domain-containing protein [Robiginitomaculum sp.]|nr:OB-fold domain-containing protein [Robiginitomaculum sp.]